MDDVYKGIIMALVAVALLITAYSYGHLIGSKSVQIEAAMMGKGDWEKQESGRRKFVWKETNG